MNTSYIQYTIDTNRGTIIRTKEGWEGKPGQSATIAVDSTITLEPGSDAYVENIGTPGEAHLVFGIPQGNTGSVGPAGRDGQDGESATIQIGTTTTGQAGTNASVENVGTSSAAVFNFTIPRGADGSDGQAATISVGNVTSGSTPSVTNVGTSTNAVFDFVLEKGETGQNGPGVPQGGTQGQILAKSSSTDYDTEWINAPENITDSFKEFGSKIVINVQDKSVEDSKHIHIQISSVSSYTGGDLIDWGDGTTPTNVTSSGNYPHDYAAFGTYTLTFYGNGHPQHNVDLGGITQANRYSLESKASIVGQGCLKWKFVKVGTAVNFSAWNNGDESGNRVLGQSYDYRTTGTELILPNASKFQVSIGYAPNLKSVTFPAITTEITNPFNSRTPDNLQKIVMMGMTPPTISNLDIPSTTYILVPWSPDHSILNAYKAATGWSDYASRIYDGDPSV